MSAYNRTLQGYVRDFLAQREDGKSFTKDDLARWALEHNLVKHDRGYVNRLVEQKVANDFAIAMREAHTTDAKGRSVREMYAARIGGKMRWNSRSRANRGFAEASFVLRRNGIVQDCHRLKDDADSFSDDRCPDNPIQMTFDFTADLAELEAAKKAS